MKNESLFTLLPEVQERTYLENDLSFAFLTNIPITPGHTLICPKRVVATIDELREEELRSIHALLLDVKERLCKTLGAQGFNYAWNEGREFGQSVPHFHLHVVPRQPNDSGITEYEPREFLYRPGSRQESPEDELAHFAALLR